MNKIDIFNANAEFFERFNNSLEDTANDRHGRTRFTVTGLENKVEFAVNNAQGRIKKAEDDAIANIVDTTQSVGTGKYLREGAYGIGVTNAPILANDSNYGNVENGIYSIRGGFVDKPSYGTTGSTAIRAGWSEAYYAVVHFSTGNGRISAKLVSNDNTRGWQEFYTDMNTYPDSNGVLHNTKTPIDTLNTSDMADTVVDNDLLTVTSGAVYRAIQELRAEIALLKGKLNE